MRETPMRVRVEQVDAERLWPALRLLRAFGMALSPALWLPAFGLLLVLHLVGLTLDAATGPVALPGEFDAYCERSAEGFSFWLEQRAGETPALGAYAAVRTAAGQAASEAALGLLSGRWVVVDPRAGPGLVSGLYRLVVQVPGYAWSMYPWPMVLFGVLLVGLKPWLGGAMARGAGGLASAHPQGLSASLRFSRKRFGTFLFAPLMPAVVAVPGLIVLVLFAWVLWVPWIQALAALFLPIALVLGAGLAVLLIGWVLVLPLFHPAVAVDDADAFDAASRAYSFCTRRLLSLLGYHLATLLLFLVAFGLLGWVAELGLSLTRGVMVWASGGADGGVAALWPTPGAAAMPPELSGLQALAWGLLSMWVGAVWLWVGAYGLAFLVACGSLVYLSLRESVDGVAVEEFAEDPDPAGAAAGGGGAASTEQAASGAEPRASEQTPTPAAQSEAPTADEDRSEGEDRDQSAGDRR